MGSFVPGRYSISTSDALVLIATAKNNLLADHPELKPFQNEIGSYIARAVESRNERGIARNGTLQQDEAAQVRYLAELSLLAEREARECIRRFRHRVEAPDKQKASDTEEDNKKEKGGIALTDFDALPIRW